MHAIIIDIETNAIEDWNGLSDLKTMHCMVIRNGSKVETYNHQKGNIEKGLKEISLADVVIGHNAMSFDIRALEKLYPDFRMSGCLRDTMLLARLVWPDIRDQDFKRGDEYPKNLIGSHSLKAWGHRLGEYKGEHTDWSEWSQEMEDYCVQDTHVTLRLWQEIMREKPSEESVILEHEFAAIIQAQERHGFRFDVASAKELHAELLDKKAELERELQRIFPPVEVPMKTPQYWEAGDEQYPTKSAALKAGHKPDQIKKGPVRVKTIPFNPGSRDQISRCLIEKYGWKPKDFTNGGKPKIDESILKALDFGEAKALVNYLTISKRLGQLAEGAEAWLRCVKGEMLHGRVNTNGTLSGRCSHARPNLAQVPSVSSPYGKECRALFVPDEGHVLVGADASGLELRMLAHYLAFFDDGAYAKEVCEGDIHTYNQHAAGLDERSQAKRLIYAWLYGGGDALIGDIVGGGSREGKQIKKRFMDRLPAFKKLKKFVDNRVETRGVLTGLDGRNLPVRSKHSALNLALQSAGAVVMKEATVILGRALKELPPGSVHQVAHIHDEIQLSVKESLAEQVGKAAVSSIQRAGESLNLKVPLDGEFKIGANWSETH